MQSIPQPHVKIKIGSEAIFLCDPNGEVRKEVKPIYKYFINPLYKQS